MHLGPFILHLQAAVEIDFNLCSAPTVQVPKHIPGIGTAMPTRKALHTKSLETLGPKKKAGFRLALFILYDGC